MKDSMENVIQSVNYQVMYQKNPYLLTKVFVFKDQNQREMSIKN